MPEKSTAGDGSEAPVATSPTGFADATARYYEWLERFLRLEADGLRLKVDKMDKKSVFPFLRGTFYRWRVHFAAAAEPTRAAPPVLSVGDVHLENFGTWRDAEGRLSWGVNDFDEAAELAFTSDLARLAASLAIALADQARSKEKPIRVDLRQGVTAILRGYETHIGAPEPFVLEDSHGALRTLALSSYDAEAGWREIMSEGDLATPPEDVRNLLVTSLPAGSEKIEFRKVHKGLGSLGRTRWTALAIWQGGRAAREAKATAPSAMLAFDKPSSTITDMRRARLEAVRSHDPMSLVTETWSVRRLSPEARKLEFEHLIKGEDTVQRQELLLEAMGGEIANVHAGTARNREELAIWLRKADPEWLITDATNIADAVRVDHANFRKDTSVVGELPGRRGPA